MATKTINVEGNRIVYDEVGNGSPVLLLHGAFQTRYLWRDIARDLSSDHLLIAPDLRGLGDTGEANQDYRFETVADELIAMISELGHERYAVVGHDLGGGVGYAVASKAREHVSGFAFLDMLLPGFGFEQAWIPQPEGHFLWFAALNAVPGVIETLLLGREREYLELVLRGGFTANQQAISDEDMNHYEAAYARPGALQALGGYFRSMWANADFVTKSASEKLTIPVMAMGGQYSVGEGAAQSMRGVAVNVQSVIVPNSGHWLPEENESFVAESLQSFLTEISSVTVSLPLTPESSK